LFPEHLFLPRDLLFFGNLKKKYFKENKYFIIYLPFTSLGSFIPSGGFSGFFVKNMNKRKKEPKHTLLFFLFFID
jgi:hypothetical protein